MNGRLFVHGSLWPPSRRPTELDVMMSVGNTPRSRKPSVNENFGEASSSLPIHLGGSASLFLRYTYTAAITSSTMIAMSIPFFVEPLLEELAELLSPLAMKYAIVTIAVIDRAAPST